MKTWKFNLIFCTYNFSLVSVDIFGVWDFAWEVWGISGNWWILSCEMMGDFQDNPIDKQWTSFNYEVTRENFELFGGVLLTILWQVQFSWIIISSWLATFVHSGAMWVLNFFCWGTFHVKSWRFWIGDKVDGRNIEKVISFLNFHFQTHPRWWTHMWFGR